MLKVAMARGRRLKKRGGGELEVDKQNLALTNQEINEQIVASANRVIIEQIIASTNQAIAKQIVVPID